MNVKELLETLKDVPEDYTVLIGAYNEEGYCAAGSVEVGDEGKYVLIEQEF